MVAYANISEFVFPISAWTAERKLRLLAVVQQYAKQWNMISNILRTVHQNEVQQSICGGWKFKKRGTYARFWLSECNILGYRLSFRMSHPGFLFRWRYLNVEVRIRFHEAWILKMGVRLHSYGRRRPRIKVRCRINRFQLNPFGSRHSNFFHSAFRFYHFSSVLSTTFRYYLNNSRRYQCHSKTISVKVHFGQVLLFFTSGHCDFLWEDANKKHIPWKDITEIISHLLSTANTLL